jgi:hypothetical protein
LRDRNWHLERVEWNDPKEKMPVPILEARITSSPEVKNGKKIPVLILDTTSRPDFENYVRFHLLQKTGECKSSWGRTPTTKESNLTLVLQFLSPSRCIVLVEFELKKDWGIIDQIIQNEAVWLCPARSGEKLEEIFDLQRLLLVEFSSREFALEWEKILVLTLKNQGLTQKEIERAKKKWRKL